MKNKLSCIIIASIILISSLLLLNCYSYTKIKSTANPLPSNPKYKKMMIASAFNNKQLQQKIDKEVVSQGKRNNVEFIPWMKIDSTNIGFIKDWMFENEIDGILIIQDTSGFENSVTQVIDIPVINKSKNFPGDIPNLKMSLTYNEDPFHNTNISLYDLKTSKEVWTAVAEIDMKHKLDLKKYANSFL